MFNSRRSFFQGLISKLSKEETILKNPAPAGFPVTLNVKYIYPPHKKANEVHLDMKRWSNKEKFHEIFYSLKESGDLSGTLEYISTKEFSLSRLYFKNIESFEKYQDLMIKNKVTDSDLQEQLGYKVISFIS